MPSPLIISPSPLLPQSSFRTPHSLSLIQDWEFAHLLICSNCSEQMSKCEPFAQFALAQDEWATVSKPLRSLMTNEQMWAIPSDCSIQMSESLGCFEQIAHFLFRSQKMSGSLKQILYVLYSFFKVLLIPSERSERMAQVAQDKWATVSVSLMLLRRNERSWENPSGRSP